MRHGSFGHESGDRGGDLGLSMVVTALSLGATAILTVILLSTMFKSSGSSTTSVTNAPGVEEATALQRDNDQHGGFHGRRCRVRRRRGGGGHPCRSGVRQCLLADMEISWRRGVVRSADRSDELHGAGSHRATIAGSGLVHVDRVAARQLPAGLTGLSPQASRSPISPERATTSLPPLRALHARPGSHKPRRPRR